MSTFALHPVFGHLPIELVCNILSHLLLSERAGGRLDSAANLMLVCRTVHGILRPVFGHTVVLRSDGQNSRFLSSQMQVRDLRRIHIYGVGFWRWYGSESLRALDPVASRLVAVDVDIVLLELWARACPEFAPREVCIRHSKFQKLLALPPTCLVNVTHIRGPVPYFNVDGPPDGLESLVNNLLARLPAVTHVAFDLAQPLDETSPRYTPKLVQYCSRPDLAAILRPVLRRAQVHRVVLLLWGFFVTLRGRIVSVLRTVEDERVCVWKETRRTRFTFDIIEADARDALQGVSAWDKGTPVFSRP